MSFHQLLGKARDALRGGEAAWRVQSTGEKLAVALVLNRADWVQAMGYTLGEAIDRIGFDWLDSVPRVERALNAEFTDAERARFAREEVLRKGS